MSGLWYKQTRSPRRGWDTEKDDNRPTLRFEVNYIIDEDRIKDLADNSSVVRAMSYQLHKKFVKSSPADRKNFNEALQKCMDMGGLKPVSSCPELDNLKQHFLPINATSSEKPETSPVRYVMNGGHQTDPGSPYFNYIMAVGHNCTFIARFCSVYEAGDTSTPSTCPSSFGMLDTLHTSAAWTSLG